MGCVRPVGLPRFRAALESHREALETVEASGEQAYWKAVVTARFGAALTAIGRFDEALPILERAAGLAAESENPVLVSQAASYLGDRDDATGDLAGATERYDEALRQATAAADARSELPGS